LTPIGTTTASTSFASNQGLKTSDDLNVWVGYPMWAMSAVLPLIIVSPRSVVRSSSCIDAGVT